MKGFRAHRIITLFWLESVDPVLGIFDLDTEHLTQGGDATVQNSKVNPDGLRMDNRILMHLHHGRMQITVNMVVTRTEERRPL